MNKNTIRDYIRKKILSINKYLFKNQYINIIDLIEPNILGLPKKGYGKDGDGTYILPPDLIKDGNFVLLSFGILDDISFEKDFHKDYPHIPIYAFDPTIEELPEKFEKINFQKIGLAGSDNPSKDLYSIDSILKRIKIESSQKLILKLDIEGWEWMFLNSLEKSQLDIPVITMEIHFFPTITKSETLLLPFKLRQKEKIIKKLLKHYYIYHIHSNNYEYTIFNDFVFPNYLELTLISKKTIRSTVTQEVLKLNRPNVAGSVDYQYPFRQQ